MKLAQCWDTRFVKSNLTFSRANSVDSDLNGHPHSSLVENRMQKRSEKRYPLHCVVAMVQNFDFMGREVDQSEKLGSPKR